MDPLGKFNALSDTAASKALLDCCGSTQWCQAMSRSRPFKETATALAASDKIWQNLSRVDWLEAFSRRTAPEADASEETVKALAAAGKKYEEKFGYGFITATAEESAEERLATLKARMENDRQSEIIISAEEQRKIIRLKLEALLSS